MKRKAIREIKKPVVRAAEPVQATAKLRNSLGIIIAAFAFILYAQSISFNYTLDDQASLKENKIVTKGLSGIPVLLKTDYWYGFGDVLRPQQYRPASLILFAVEWQFFPGNPHVSHLVNVLLYSLTCFLLFMLLCELFSNQNLIIPLISTLLYVVHPIHTEVVNSIKSSDDILCFFFLIISTLFFIYYLKNQSKLKLALALAAYFAALLSKETAITFLIVIPLTIFVFVSTEYKKIFTVFLSLAVTTCVYLFLRAQIVQPVAASLIESTVNNTLYSAPDFASREATAFYILLRYIFLLIVPHPLCYDYSFSQIKIRSFTDVTAIAGLLVYLALGIYAFIAIRKKSVIAFAILFYLITLSVASNVFLLIGATMAERFLYIPSLGYCLLLAVLLTKFMKTELSRNKFNSINKMISANRFLFIVVFALTAAFASKTFARSKVWKNNATLFGHDVEVSTQSARTHSNWATTLLHTLYPAEKNKNKQNKLLDQSIEEFKKAIAIYNYAPDDFLNLGSAYTKKNDSPDAIINYEMALKLVPKPDAELFNSLSYEYIRTSQFDKAISIADSAIKYDPASAKAYNNRGCALGAKAKYGESIPPLMKSISLDSLYAPAYKNLGVTYFFTKEYSRAIENYNTALRLDSSDLQSGYFIGLCYQAMGDTVKAKLYLDQYSQANK